MADTPQTVQGPDGQTYQFPAGTTKEQAIAYFKKKGIGAVGKLSAIPTPSLRNRLTEVQKFAPGEPLGVKDVENMGAGLLSIPLHPVDALAGLGGVITAPFEMAAGRPFSSTTPGQMVQQAKENPRGFVESGIGQIAFGEGVGELAPRLIPKSSASRTVTDLVKDTQAENAKAATKAQADYAKATETHKAEAAEAAHETQGRELAHKQRVEAEASKIRAQRIKANREAAEAHAKAVEDTKAANTAATKEQAKIPATREKLEAASQELQAQIETARAKALKEGNQKYNGVNEKLNELPADVDTVQNGLTDALSKIKGTETEPPILKGIAKRIEEGDVLTYRDLQGYYTELNAELSKGTLPGDIYTAYDTMHEAVSQDMQRIADAQGAGAQLLDARNYWRRMKQTFGKPYNPTDVANVVREKATGRLASEEEQANRVRLLGSFDKAIPQTVEHISNLRKGLESLPKEQPIRNVVKPLPPKPAPLSTATAGAEATRSVPPPERVVPSDKPQLNAPAPRKIGQTEVEAAKRAGVENASDWVRNRGVWAAAWPAIYIIRDLFHGNVPNIGTAGMEVAGTLAVSRAISKALENPTLVRFLSQATPADVAAIPPDLRGDFPKIVQAAARSGAEISSTLRAMTTGGAALAPRKHPSDEWSQQPTR